MNYKERMGELVRQLNDANYRYYVQDDPAMPDFEYDRLLRELEDLEMANPQLILPDSPTQRVGGEALSKFEKVYLKFQNVSKIESFQSWQVRRTVNCIYPGAT